MLSTLLLLVACEQTSGKSQEVLGTNTTLTPIEKTCKRAYTGREGALAKFKKSLKPEDAEKVPDMPDKQEFIAVCAKLPEDAAKCLDPNWYQVDQEACITALEAANKDDLEQVQRLLSGLPTGEEEKEEEADPEGEEGADDGEAGEAEEEPAEGAGNLVQQAMEQGEGG